MIFFQKGLSNLFSSNPNEIKQIYMWEMFNGAAFYSHDLSAWKVSKNLDLNVIYKANMFHLSRLENRPDFQPRNQPQPAQSSNLN